MTGTTPPDHLLYEPHHDGSSLYAPNQAPGLGDVVVVRVHELVAEDVWRPRFGRIVDFEAEVAAVGTRVVKVFLHIGHAEQGARLAERLEREDKHWKYNPADLEARLRWDRYQEAWAEAVERTGTEQAPWHVVPADRKWYARLAVTNLDSGRQQSLSQLVALLCA